MSTASDNYDGFKDCLPLLHCHHGCVQSSHAIVPMSNAASTESYDEVKIN